MIYKELIGGWEVHRRFRRMIANIPVGSKSGMMKGMDDIRDIALSILASQRKATNRTHGDPQNAIHDKETWVKHNFQSSLEGTEGELLVNSNHAAAVEYGTVSPIVSSRKGGLMKLGPNGPWVTEVKGQSGKYYITNTINQKPVVFAQSCGKEMMNAFRRVI